MATHHFLAFAAIMLVASGLSARSSLAQGVCGTLGVLSFVASILTWPLPA